MKKFIVGAVLCCLLAVSPQAQTPVPENLSQLLIAIKENDVARVKELLQTKEIDLNPPFVPMQVKKPLSRAARDGNNEIVELLINAGADINGMDSYHDVPLIFALENGHIETARLLIEKGADLNIPNSFGISPFIGICMTETPEFVKFALAHGADPITSYHCTVSSCKPGQFGISALEAAKQNKEHGKEIEQILHDFVAKDGYLEKYMQKKLYRICLNAANDEFKNKTDENKKSCECALSFMMEQTINELNTARTPQDLKSGFSETKIIEIEKKCGKLPKKIKN